MSERILETIEGIVSAVIFKNEENGYTVAKARLFNDAEVIIVGVMPFLGCGEEIFASGTYLNHPQYGSQFQVVEYERNMPSDVSGIYEYLASRAIKGIGPKTARAIVNEFGVESLDVLASKPQELCKIKGITKAKAMEIQDSFLRQSQMRLIVEFLMLYGLPSHFAASLMRFFGPEAVDVIKQNPFLLCTEPFGLAFGQADAMARELGFDDDNPFRLEAALLYELDWNLQNGHTFIPRDKLLAVTQELCGADLDSIALRLEVLLSQGRAVCEDVSGLEAVYLFQAHRMEKFIAEEILRLAAMTIVPPINIEQLLTAEAAKSKLNYNDLQRKAICMCFNTAVSLITGGPGTGKTTALRTMVNVLEAYGLSVSLAAPTGRAAKAMSELCGKEAKTIHRLLEVGFDDTGRMQFIRNQSNPLNTDVVIVDEASMIDIFLAGALLEAIKPHTRVVFVGDSDQLPPIGAGNFFADLLAVLPHVRLVEIFRQAQGSDIIMNAHMINRGETPPLRKNDNDFFFVSTRSPDSTVSTIVTLMTQRIPARFGIEPKDIQVICQSRQTACGTGALNQSLQAALNPAEPHKGEIRWGGAVFRQGDKVMQVRNNYDRLWHRLSFAQGESNAPDGSVGTGIYNGDIGNIVYVDRAAQKLVVSFDDKESEYGFEELDELEHAFAITTHKSQGSEYPAVIIPAFSTPRRLISRNLLYTAVTRAKKHLTVVGRDELLAEMVAQYKTNRRYGALKLRLREGMK